MQSWCRLILLLFTIVERATLHIVRNNVGMEVANGRIAYVRKNLLSFNVEPGQICKVEVITNEPMHQRVGVFTPEIFDCDYHPKSVRYEHNGSPFLNKDSVKMRVYVLLSNQTLQETVYFHITILNSRCDVIQVNQVPLIVPTTSKLSNPITRDVVDFDYDRNFDTLCQVRISQNGFPAHGRLVLPENSTSIREIQSESDYVMADDLQHSCDDFVMLRLRYEHISPPTPDVDYIPLHVIVTDRRSGSVLLQERHWLPVRISGAIPNQPPKPSFSNMYILEVDQFVITNILPMTVSAVDGETSSEKLIFNITKPPSMGYITHLSDESKPVYSFKQQDLQELQIAYQPPNISFPQRQTFNVEFVVYDAYFSQSQPIRCLFSVRVAYTNAPRVSKNKGLTMLEGQSRVIDNTCLQVVDKDNLNQVRFTLAGGLRHGRMYVNDRPGFSFRWNDIESGVVSYRHDDTDTRKDFIVFRIADWQHSTRFKLPISVLPKDDAPPFLINNIVFQVQEGQTILIHRFMLEASDSDSSADYITFNVTVPPRAGEVQKRRKWERAGWSINKFKQADLYQGLIYYKHLGSEMFEDSFEFTLIDSCRPNPNVSPPHRVTINITPVDDLPPQPSTGNSLTLTVNETDVVYVTAGELHYTDVEQEDSDVTFTVTTEPYRVDGTNQDAGRLIFTDDMVMLMKDPTVPTLRTFTQSAINHKKVAYMPPISDVGLHPIDVQFVFTVRDDSNKEVTGQTFAITVLPVDNLAPTISVTELCLNEGGTEIIAADLVQVQDADTDKSYLSIILSKSPAVGRVQKDGKPLRRGDSFTFHDIEHFRMTYSHDGSETHRDDFELTVSDGKQNSSTVLFVKMEPVDDEHPVLSDDGEERLDVPEGGSSAFTKLFLSATDADTEDENLIFEILTPPSLGDITIHNEPVTTFYQRDISNGKVYYTHRGSEVGKRRIDDFAIVMVSDRRGEPYDAEANTTTKDLHFAIIPVNNRPPRVAIGHRLFECEEAGIQTITHHYLMATDEDTTDNELMYFVESPPKFGYIEDITPRPGFEKITPKQTSAFTHEKLMSGYVRYKQSKHDGIEPTSDQFSVAVSDGLYRSPAVSLLISIRPTNDEEPIISVNNVTCHEGNMQPINIHIDDLDVPNDQVMVFITDPPSHGMVMNEMSMLKVRRSVKRKRNSHHSSHSTHDMEPLNEFSLHELHESMVIPAYMHDGSEHTSDRFDIKITDGKHVNRKTLMVKVMPINDEQPVIQVNEGIVLELGDSKVISNVALHTIDEDTEPSDIVYELHSVPRRGYLQLKVDDQDDWINLQLADTFTEYDVEMNKLRYKHASVLGSKGKDSFRFSVTDGDFTSPRQNFLIEIQHTKKSTVHIVTHPLHVNESQKAFITTDILMARDDSHNPQEITYDVIRGPVFGQIEYVAFPGVPIEMFTQLDLLGRSVVYAHTSKGDSPVDTFRVMANNGLKTREADVSVLIKSVDKALPSLIIRGNENAVAGRADLTLYRGSSVAISDMVIKIQDPDSSKENLKMMIIDHPQHGTLSLNGVDFHESNLLVSEVDLEKANLFYRHNGDGALIDQFTFTVTDGVHPGYLFNGLPKHDPYIFTIKIDTLDETPPVLLVNQISTSIQPLGSDRASDYGITLDKHVLRAADEQSSNPGDVTFTITQPPSYGIVKIKTTRTKDSVEQFTQLDVNERTIIYVISSKLNVTNDSFVFDVEDSWGNTLSNNRFAMSWSRVEMNERKAKVCENAGHIAVGIRRHGNLLTSSFVGISTKPGTAKLGIDFKPNTASQIQFDPNVNLQTWRVDIAADDLEERKEKFVVNLHTPVNCVLAPTKTTSRIKIIDQSRRFCGGRTGKTNRKKKKQKRRQLKKRKKNKSKTTFLQKDSPNNKGKKKVKYGKLGPGTTVSPASYFRNKTVRIWTYHGLLPATVDETDDPSVVNSLTFSLPKGNSGILSKPKSLHAIKINDDDNEVNDDPNIINTSHNLFKGKFSATNSNTSATITVRGRSGKSSKNSRIKKVDASNTNVRHRSLPPSIDQQCILTKRGALFYESVSKLLYQCNGAQWIPWTPPLTSAQSRFNGGTKNKRCNDGWTSFEEKCYFFGSSSDSEISWNSAQRTCRETHAADLVAIHSRKQLNWLWKETRRSKFLIGLNRKINPNIWEWISREPVTFSNWKKGNPKSNRGDCVMVTRKRWTNIQCIQPISNIKYICMKQL